MSLKDDVVIVLRNVSHRRLRSWLTVIGVVIGVAAIIALVSASRSLEASIQEQFEAFGSDKISIYAASSGGPPGFDANLNVDDADAVRKVKDYGLVVEMLFKSAKVEFRGEPVNALISGFDSGIAVETFKEFNLDFREGGPFESDSNKVVIGSRVADDLFDSQLFVGSKLEINSEKFEVVGIVESVGNPQDDSNIYMPLEVMRDLFGDRTSVSFIVGKVKPGSDLNKVSARTAAELSRIRSEESFEVSTPEQLIEQLSIILGILQGVLAGIAAISLLVGSVGIANSMYTSVLERIRDIGIMKAVGATNAEIAMIFLIEAGLIGLVGGIIGIAFGIGIAYLIGFAAAQAGFGVLKIRIEPLLILFSLIFAVGVGAASGYFPARRASSLKPADALRK
ncbi:ABC transporter permease [Candidatus Woesearchaeota archaeon]|nr:ABC transporter permease [Candidatus Woesearchaeota archaeon]